ncbi:Trp biosynthesis-associated membrane protein [Sinomonas atrocyanea]|uniref:Trp biosynthesis-associated membrane protein n=1 Tax=Sinomonas atrocyanea TaxID=37927 RepID=UPI003D96B88C
MADTAGSQRAEQGAPRWARKPIIVTVAVGLALAAFGATTQTWLDAEVRGAAVRTAHLAVQGSKAATSVSALALVGLAGTLAVAVAGRIGRTISGAIVILAGVGIVTACLAVLADPRAAAEGSIAQATGLAGTDAAVGLTAFPALAAAAGALLAGAGVVLLVASRHWPTRTRYDAAVPGSRGRGAAGGGAEGGDASRSAVDGIDGWDSLSRGEDPTD